MNEREPVVSAQNASGTQNTGGTRNTSGPRNTRAAVEDAERRGAAAHVLDGSELVTKRSALDGIAAVLSFPEWAGRNLDALYDCLTDLSWLPEGEHVLIWSGSRALAEHDPKAHDKINAVLRDAARNTLCGRDFEAVLTED